MRILEPKKHYLDAGLFCGFVIIASTILSCSKNEIHENCRQYDAYELIRDWYFLDTEFCEPGDTLGR